MIHISQLTDITALAGQPIIACCAVDISAQKLTQFLQFSDDTNPIHSKDQTDTPIIPANMLLAQLPNLLQTHICFSNNITGFTVGYKKVRFRRKIFLGKPVTVSIQVQAVKALSNGVFVDYKFVFKDPQSNEISAEGVMSDHYSNVI